MMAEAQRRNTEMRRTADAMYAEDDARKKAFEEWRVADDRERRAKLSEYSKLWDFTDEEYRFIEAVHPIIENSPDKQFKKERLAAAGMYSKLFQIPLKDAFLNLESLHQKWTGETFAKKTGLQAAADSIKLTNVSAEYNRLAKKLDASVGKDPDLLQAVTELEKEVDRLKDKAPMPWQEGYVSLGGWHDVGRVIRGVTTSTLENLRPVATGMAAAALAVTGVGAVAAAAGLSAGTASLLVSGAQVAAIAANTYSDTQGIKYREMTNAGIPHDIASTYSKIDAIFEGAIEGALGGLEGAAGKAIASTIVPKAVGQATARWYVSGKMGIGARAAVNWLVGGFQESSEELLQSGSGGVWFNAAADKANRQREELLRKITEEPVAEIRKELEKELEKHPEVDRKKWKPVLEEGIDAAIRAFGSALILGVPVEIGAYKADTRAAATLAGMAREAPSAAVFQEAAKAAEVTQGFNNPFTEGMTTDDEAAFYKGVFESQQKYLTPEQVEAKRKQAEDAEYLAETTDYRNAEVTHRIIEETDEKTGEKTSYTETGLSVPETGEPFRENGKLWFDVDEERREDGAIKGEMLFGDPRKEEGNYYGGIHYVEKDGKIEITKFTMLKEYEGLKQEAFRQFTEQFAGKDIAIAHDEHDAKLNEARAALRDELASQNPRGPKHGLNYYESAEQVGASEGSWKVAEQFRTHVPNATPLQIALGAQVFDAFYKRKGESVDGAMNRALAEVTNVPNAGTAEALSKGIPVQGAEWFKATAEGIRHFIYVNKNAGNASTVIHELGHVVARNFTRAEMRIADRALDGYKLKNGTVVHFEEGAAWGDNQHEAFTEALENYLTNGMVPNEEARPLFEKIKEFMKKIYKTFKGWTELSPQVEKFYQSLLTGELADQAKAEESALRSREEGRVAAQKEITGNDAERATGATAAAPEAATGMSPNDATWHAKPPETGGHAGMNAESRKQADAERERMDAFISSPDVPFEDKAGAVMDAAGMEMLELYQKALYQIDEEKNQNENPIDYLKANAQRLTDVVKREQVIKEIDELARTYPPETNKYLAPNGKESKLNHAQWYAVRTPSFKEWFGDWEVLKNKEIIEGNSIADILSSAVPILNGEIITSAVDWIDKNPQGAAKTIIGEIEITRRGIRDDFSHIAFPDKLASLPAVKTVLEKGAYLGQMDDITGKSIQNYYFAAPATIDGNNKIIFVRARKKGDGLNRFYVHDVYTLNDIKKSGTTKTTGTTQNAQNKGNVPDLYKSIIHDVIDVNPDLVSKIVDENGEPRALWHQTGAEIEAFEPRRQGAGQFDNETPFGIFLKPDDRDIGLAGKKQMPLFAMIANPLRVADRDALRQYLEKNIEGYAGLRGRYENTDKTFQTRLEALEAEFDKRFETWEAEHPEAGPYTHAGLDARQAAQEKIESEIGLDTIMTEWRGAGNELSAQMKELADRHFRSGEFDGIILEKDEGGVGKKTTQTFIAFDPAQVKSATENAGTYDSGNSSILFQIIGEKGAGALDKTEEAGAWIDGLYIARLDNLSVARQMEEAGKDAKAVRLATGWERGADGKWRYEIPDIEVNIDKLNYKKMGYKDPYDFYEVKQPLKDLIKDAAGLLTAYPELADARVEVVHSDKMGDGDIAASWDDGLKLLSISSILFNSNDIQKTANLHFAHEVQHAIQDIEGFAGGGSSASAYLKKESPAWKMLQERRNAVMNPLGFEEYAKNAGYENTEEAAQPYKKYLADHEKRFKKGMPRSLDIEIKKSVAWDYYWRLAGEVEARNAEKRMPLSSAERLKTPLAETEDVGRGDQISTLYQIIGEKGAGALDKSEEADTRLGGLSIARQMELAGKDARMTRLATGWERGADGKWRYEIPDIKITESGREKAREGGSLSLSEVIEAGELFEAYPDLKVYAVEISNDAQFNGAFNPFTKTITVNWLAFYSPVSKVSENVLTHEVQHAIQDIEGFAEGGNPRGADQALRELAVERIKKFDDNQIEALDKWRRAKRFFEPQIEHYLPASERESRPEVMELRRRIAEADEAFIKAAGQETFELLSNVKGGNFNEENAARLYRSLAGEVEARNAVTRTEMTTAERLKTLLADTEDVEREDQIFIHAGMLGGALYQTAFHGSPYRFEHFDHSHMGEGEGFQAFGYGTYLAGNIEVAEYYHEALTEHLDLSKLAVGDMRNVYKIVIETGLADHIKKHINNKNDFISGTDIKNYVKETGEDFFKVLSNWLGSEEEAQKLLLENDLKSLLPGQLYKVEIPEDDEMLDWDKPLAEQPDKVREALKKVDPSRMVEWVPYPDGIWIMNGFRKIVGVRKAGSMYEVVRIVEDPNSISANGMYSSDLEPKETSVGRDYKTLEEAKNEALNQASEEIGYRSGEYFYSSLGFDQKGASEYLSSLGIKGIRYFDRYSRDIGEGTHNYVIFDAADINITNTLYQLSAEQKETVEAAKEVYGTTEDFIEAGYLLPDGTMLDLSGKKKGQEPGRRNLDHREMNHFKHDGKAYRPGMEGFMLMGNIRLQPEFGGIQFAKPPTAKQLRTLRDYIRNFNGEVVIDFSEESLFGWGKKELYVKDSIEYGETHPDRIINDIKNYYEKGELPPDVPVLFQTAWNASVSMFDRFDNYYAGKSSFPKSHGWGHSFYSQREAADWFSKKLGEYKGAYGWLYEAKIPDDSELMDWGKPLDGQPEAVKNAAAKLVTWDKEGKSDFNEAYNLRQFNDGKYGFYRSINGKMKWDTVEEAQAAAKPEIMKALDGGSFYNGIAERIGEKNASLLLDSMGVRGIKYMDRTIEKMGLPASHSYTVFGDQGISMTPLLFQLGDEKMMEEAADFEDGKDYRGYLETFGSLPEELEGYTEKEIDAWFDEFVKRAKQAALAPEPAPVAEKERKGKQTPAELDQEFNDLIGEGRALEDFVETMNAMYHEDYAEWGAIDEADAAERDRQAEISDELRKRLKHPTWQSIFMAKGRIGPTQRKGLLTMIQNSPRTYRDIYAKVMGREDYAVSAEDASAAALKHRITDSRIEEVDSLTPEKLRLLAQDLDVEEFAEKLKKGRVTFNDPMEKEYIKRLNDKITAAEEELKKADADRQEDNDYIEMHIGLEFNKTFDRALKAREYVKRATPQLERALKTGEKDAAMMARHLRRANSNYDAIVKELEALAREHKLEVDVKAALAEERFKEEFDEYRKSAKAESKLNAALAAKAAREELRNRLEEMKAKRQAAKEITKAKKDVIKRIFRRASPQEVNAEQGMAMAVIQRFAEPALTKGVNEFLGEVEGQDLRPVFEAWKVDERLRNSLLSDKNKTDEGKMRRLFGKEKYESLTEEERKYLSRKIAPVDWIEELGLEEISRRRNENYPKREAERLAAQSILPPDVYYRIMDKPFSAWTLEEAEELAKIIDGLAVRGKEIYKAHIDAERRRIREYQSGIIKTVKTVPPGMSDDEAKKILEKYDEGMAGTDDSAAKRRKFSSVFPRYSDMNVYRFARMLDNGETDGRNMAALYRSARDALNQKLAAVDARQKILTERLKELKVDLEELWNRKAEIDFGGAMGKKTWTHWELLGFVSAARNDYSREALIGGNMLLERERVLYQGDDVSADETVPLSLTAFTRFDAAQETAKKIIEENPVYQQVIDAFDADFKVNGRRAAEALLRYNNTYMEEVEYYFPMRRTEAVKAPTQGAADARELMSSSAGAFRLFVEKGFTKKRTEIPIQYQTGIKLDLFSVWTEAVEREEHFIAYGQAVKDMNAIYKNDRRVRDALQLRYGRDAVKYIDRYVNELANPKKENTKNDLDKVIRTMRGNAAVAYLSYNVTSIIKQGLTSPAPFFGYMNPVEYWGTMVEYAANHKALWEEIIELSPYMKHRSANMMVEMVNERAKQRADSKVNAAIDKFGKTGMGGLEWIDRTCVAPGWLVLFRKEMKRLTEADSDMGERDARVKAARYADDITSITQPSGYSMDIPQLFKGNSEMGKAYLQFTQSLSNIWQTMRYDMPQMMREKKHSQIAGTVIGYAVAGVMLGAITAGFDDDDDEAKKAAKLLWWSTLQFTDAFPIIGSEATNLAEQLITGKTHYASGANLVPAFDKIRRAAETGIRGARKGEFDKAFKAAAQAAEGYAIMKGFPVSGPKTVGRFLGINDDEEGINIKPWALAGRK